MKRILSLILALSILFCLGGCVFLESEDEEEFDVDEYLEEAEALVEDGDLEGAEKLLKKGIRKAEDPDDAEELEALLEIVQSMMDDDDPKKETANVPTAAAPSTETTQQPTGVIEQETTSGRNLLENFSSDDMYRINIFLSNFSEARFQGYPCSEYDMLMFGYKYAKVNNREVLGNTDADYYINKANMDSILKRFFGTTVNLSEGTVLNERNYPVTYRDGAYYYPAADGASVSYCSIATSMVKNADGTYTVTFHNYEHVNPHESMSAYYSLTDAQASARSDIQKYGSGTAVVRDYTRSNGVETYQLVSYQLN